MVTLAAGRSENVKRNMNEMHVKKLRSPDVELSFGAEAAAATAAQNAC